MALQFTGRKKQLTDIENLIKAKQGAVFANSFRLRDFYER